MEMNSVVQEPVSVVGPVVGRAAPLTCLSVITCMWSMSQDQKIGTFWCPLMTQVGRPSKVLKNHYYYYCANIDS